MIATSIANESLTLILAPMPFNCFPFFILLLVIVITSIPRANKSFSISSTNECLANQSFVAEMTTERFA